MWKSSPPPVSRKKQISEVPARALKSLAVVVVNIIIIKLRSLLYVCPEVTVTSLHPPRLRRLAVFSIKPTLLSSVEHPPCVSTRGILSANHRLSRPTFPLNQRSPSFPTPTFCRPLPLVLIQRMEEMRENSLFHARHVTRQDNRPFRLGLRSLMSLLV